jgi:hypothetical protein
VKPARGRAAVAHVLRSAAPQLNADVAKLAHASLTLGSQEARVAVHHFGSHLKSLVARVEKVKPAGRTPRYYRLTVGVLSEYTLAASLFSAAQKEAQAVARLRKLAAATKTVQQAQRRQVKAEQALRARWGF